MNTHKLKGKMKENNMTQLKMAERLGISLQSYNSKANGKSQFTLKEAVKIIEVLNIINPAEIFFEDYILYMQQNSLLCTDTNGTEVVNIAK